MKKVENEIPKLVSSSKEKTNLLFKAAIACKLYTTNLGFTAMFSLDSSGCWHVCSLVQHFIFTL